MFEIVSWHSLVRRRKSSHDSHVDALVHGVVDNLRMFVARWHFDFHVGLVRWRGVINHN